MNARVFTCVMECHPRHLSKYADVELCVLLIGVDTHARGSRAKAAHETKLATLHPPESFTSGRQVLADEIGAGDGLAKDWVLVVCSCCTRSWTDSATTADIKADQIATLPWHKKQLAGATDGERR